MLTERQVSQFSRYFLSKRANLKIFSSPFPSRGDQSQIIDRGASLDFREPVLRDITCFYSTKEMSKYRIVMVRHGESEWNQLNLFCGWYDAGLSEKGKFRCIFYTKSPDRVGFPLSRSKGRVIEICII